MVKLFRKATVFFNPPISAHALLSGSFGSVTARTWRVKSPHSLRFKQVYRSVFEVTYWSRMCPEGSCVRPLRRRMRPSGRRMCPGGRRMRPSASRMRPSDKHMRPLGRRTRLSASVCAPQPAVCAPTIQRGSYVAAMWQQCGSHRGQSKSRFTLSKVNKTFTLIGRTWTLSDLTDGQTDAQTTLVVHIMHPHFANKSTSWILFLDFFFVHN
jgi:hypothetical protein